MRRETPHRLTMVSAMVAALVATCFLSAHRWSSRSGLPEGIVLGMSPDDLEAITGPILPTGLPIYSVYVPELYGYQFWFAPPLEVPWPKDENFGLFAVTRESGGEKIFVLPEDLRGKTCSGQFNLPAPE